MAKINSRNKGHSFERKICSLFRKSYLFPYAKRHLEYQGEEAQGFDIDETGDFRFQCKKGKQVPKKIYDWYESIVSHGIKVVIVEKDYEEPMAILSLTDFMYLLKELKKNDNSEDLFY